MELDEAQKYLNEAKLKLGDIIKNEIKDLFRPNQEYLEDIINKYKYLNISECYFDPHSPHRSTVYFAEAVVTALFFQKMTHLVQIFPRKFRIQSEPRRDCVHR